MAEILVLGAGVAGLGTAMLLAGDGHEVTVVERDPAVPPDATEAAWHSWERRGVNQFRLPHYFMARFRSILDGELPAVAEALESRGCRRRNLLLSLPEAFRGPERPGDGELATLSGRRPVVESAMASVADSRPGLTIRRGVAVTGLLLGEPLAGIPRVSGVRSSAGEDLVADLVVDASGRRSPLVRLMRDAGLRPPEEEVEDSGFTYYSRHFRAGSGNAPALGGATTTSLGSLTALVLPADNDTWAIALVTSSSDRELSRLRHLESWQAVVAAIAPVASLVGEPLEPGIVTLSKIEDRHRRFLDGGRPVLCGLVAVGDAWACTNPTLGRGASLALWHGQLLRDTLREVPALEADDLATAFHHRTEAQLYPWYAWTRASDRHRLAEIDALRSGRAYETDDEIFELERAAFAAGDASCLRAILRSFNVLQLPEQSFAEAGLKDTALRLGGGWRGQPLAGPDRAGLLELLGS